MDPKASVLPTTPQRLTQGMGMKEESGAKKVDQLCERENLVFDSLIYLEPVERF